MTSTVLTRYPLDASATRRRRRRIAAVVAVRREQSARSGASGRPLTPTAHPRPEAFDHGQ
jgi:hypothetical protein